jgi:ATP-dependent Clp protease ATP-binding subunit ClpA
VFNPLTQEDVKKIARILLDRVEKMAIEKNIIVTFTDDLLEGLAQEGFSAEWGARPLGRLIEDKVETYLAERILSGDLNSGDSIELDSSIL